MGNKKKKKKKRSSKDLECQDEISKYIYKQL